MQVGMLQAMVSWLAAEIYQAVPDPEGGSVLAT
jgi:hypothetical protein